MCVCEALAGTPTHTTTHAQSDTQRASYEMKIIKSTDPHDSVVRACKKFCDLNKLELGNVIHFRELTFYFYFHITFIPESASR